MVRNRRIKNKKFNRQYPIRFEYDGQKRFFVADFYCHEFKLVVEIDGGIHETQKDYDALRTSIIKNLGMRVIRFKNEEVLNSMDKVVAKMERELIPLSSSLTKRRGDVSVKSLPCEIRRN